MSVFTDIKPEKNFPINDFYKKGVILYGFNISRHYKTNRRHIICTFKSNGLQGTIRTTCYGDTYAIDVRYYESGPFITDKCLTTECKTLREAKSILYCWFRNKGFKVQNKQVPSMLKLKNYKGVLSPFLL